MAISGKTILVTGATGQLAGAVARGLTGDNEVIAMARFSARGSRESLEQAGVRCVHGDFVTRDFDQTPEQVDYVFHAAANTKPATIEEGMRDNAEGTAFLMHRYREASGFLHVSATGCYAAHSDPEHVFTEDEPLGGSTWFAPMYGVSKTATEGVVRSLCRLYELPTVIGRMNVAYGGPYFDGGLPGRQLDALLAGEPITLQRGQRWFQAPIHEDDITRHALILLEKATVPATIVNWGGDEGVEVESWVRYLGELVGVEPKFEYDDRPRAASWIGDHSRRKALGCECLVPWRDGMKRMIRARRPDVQIREAFDVTGLLDGKVALITGAGGGVGRAYAMLFASEGASVVVNDLSVTSEGASDQPGPHMADSVVDEIRAAGGRAVADHGDVSKAADAAAMIAVAVENFGRLDILVNNAGIFRERSFADMRWEDWTAIIDVHLHGSFLLSQIAFRRFVEQGEGGVIVNTASRTALRGKELQANYAAAKGALISLTQTIALEGREHDIRAVTVCPRGLTRGWEDAAMTSAGPITDEVRKRFSLKGPALAMLYLVSDLAKDQTGKTYFASDERISEVRWEQAPGFVPDTKSTAQDLARSAAAGELAYTDAFDANRIS